MKVKFKLQPTGGEVVDQAQIYTILVLSKYKSSSKLHGRKHFFISQQFFTWPRNSPPSMEPEYSLPYSQQPTTEPYFGSDGSSPHPLVLFLF
jgi:hypothetical protein